MMPLSNEGSGYGPEFDGKVGCQQEFNELETETFHILLSVRFFQLNLFAINNALQKSEIKDLSTAKP